MDKYENYVCHYNYYSNDTVRNLPFLHIWGMPSEEYNHVQNAHFLHSRTVLFTV